jgi:4,5:9,10-diseco-3-hydroxy-5,9,17-trioxoandrosta-1(10),2-diene-4-oate hydrolase
MDGMEEHRRIVDGFRTYYRAAGDGHPLLLVHGVGGSSLTFQWNIDELAKHFRVYAVDLPGHGRSEKPEVGYAVEDAVPFLTAFIREVCGGPTALVGVSAGGLMCALTAADHPDLVTHLVMVSSAGLGRDVNWGLRLLSLPVVRPWVESNRRDPAAVRMSLRRVLHNPELITEELVEAVAAERAEPGNGRALHTALRSNVNLFGLRRWRKHLRALRKIGVPVMVIWGAQDRFIPVRHAYRAMKHFAGAPIHIFEGCGHWPPFEHPRRFNRLVSEFVSAPGANAGG